MTATQPPQYYFTNINFNDAFYQTSSSSGLTQSQANALYLGRVNYPTSIATNTNFNGSVTVGSSTVSQSGNNLSFVNGSNTALTLTNASNTSSLSGYSTMAYLNPIPSGIMYLTGTSGFSSGSYNLETDTYGHLNFTTGTNSLNLGISLTANGNLNLYNQGVLTIPENTGTAISVPNGNINSNTISTISTATIGSTLNVGNQITLNSTIAGNRQILSSYYNFGGTLTGAPVYCGRIYGDIGTMIFDCPQPSGIAGFTFYAGNNGVTVNALNISATSINLNLNSNLPTTYSAVPTTTQLGGYGIIGFTAAQAITTNVIKNLGSINTPAGGTYIINLSVIFTATAAVTLSRHVIEASSTNGAFTNNISQQTQYENVSLTSTQSQVWTTAYTIQLTTATTIYGNCNIVFTGTGTTTGSISYTRIA